MKTKNSKDQKNTNTVKEEKATVTKKNTSRKKTKTPADEIPEEALNLLDGLEDLQEQKSETTVEEVTIQNEEQIYGDEKPDFANLEWLSTHNPKNYYNENIAKPRNPLDKEYEVLQDLKDMAALCPRIGEVDPLFFLLCEWWEIRPARVTIKNALKDYAEKRYGISLDAYVTYIIEAQLENYLKMDRVIGRMKYVRTFLKPRGDVNMRSKIVTVDIDGELYNVPNAEIVKAKYMFRDDKEMFKQTLRERGETITEEILDL